MTKEVKFYKWNPRKKESAVAKLGKTVNVFKRNALLRAIERIPNNKME